MEEGDFVLSVGMCIAVQYGEINKRMHLKCVYK